MGSALDPLGSHVVLNVDDSNLNSSYIICILAATALYFILRSENKKRANVPEDEAERAKLAFMDLTDKENPYFQYVL